jgi:cyclase
MLPTSPYFSLHEVAEGVYAAIATPGAGTRSNTGIIDLGDQTLVFDTSFSPIATQSLRKIAEELTGRPVTYLLNSHRHADHVIGNSVFRDVPIVATNGTRALITELTTPMVTNLRHQEAAILTEVEQEIATATDGWLQEEHQTYQQDLLAFFPQLEGIQVTLPTLTFNEQLTFHGSRRTTRFMSFGSNHTPSDSVLYLPEDGIVFTGDLVTIQFHPVVGQADHDHWIESMSRLEAMNLRAVVPGHGEVGTAVDVTLMKQYLTDIIAVAQSLTESGAMDTDIMAAEIPPAYQEYGWPSTYVANLTKLVARYRAP